MSEEQEIMPTQRINETREEFLARMRAIQATPEGRKYNADKNRKYFCTHKGREMLRKYDRIRSKKPERIEYTLRRDLRRNYGITLEQFNQMNTSQNGVCAICGRPNADGKRLSVDHNHSTGQVRGLLCFKHNFALGLVGEDIRELTGMMDYLNKWNPKK